MLLAPGSRLGCYEIVAPIGAGGMGEVYRARDGRLERDVAIKVVPDAFAADADRMARFDREAKLLAALNHPNIAGIYGLEDRALVMELVEGSTLAERIAQGPIPLEQARSLIDQLVDALESAHEKGVVHRDLKPANIKITPEGRVKVLDFGLAKALSNEAPAADQFSSPTLTMRASMAGVILGTAAYMSPEQARGQDVDRRADIWAFGVVVYEMLTGERLFAGATVSDTLAAVLRHEPDLVRIPATMQRVVRTCLVKDPRRRLRDIGDARALLDDAPAAVPVPGPSHRGVPLWTAGLLAAALLVTGTLLWRASRTVEQTLTRLSMDLGPDALAGTSLTVAISPDGRRLVFPVRGADGKRLLATRLLDQAQPTLLAGTENGADPFFKPDGQWVGFFTEGRMKKISVYGGLPVDLCVTANERGASWGTDGYIVVSQNLSGPLSRVADTGGTPQPLTKLAPNEATHRWPQVLPGGDTVVFSASPNSVSQEDANIEVVSLKSGQVKLVQRGGYFGRYLPSGHLLYVHQGVLFGVGFDVHRLEARGAPTRLMDDVEANPLTGGGQFDFSADPSGSGTLMYVAGHSSAQNWQVDWLDASGKTQPLIAARDVYTLPRLSPDGRKLAFMGADGNPHIYDLERETTTRVASLGNSGTIAWVPDGKHIVFNVGGILTWMRSDGAGGRKG